MNKYCIPNAPWIQRAEQTGEPFPSSDQIANEEDNYATYNTYGR